MGEGFPYLNSKYLASRAATSPSGSQSDFRDPRGGRRSQSRDLSRTKRSNISHLPRLASGKPRSRDLSDLRRGPFRRSIRMRIEIGMSGLIGKRSPVVYLRWKLRKGDSHCCILHQTCVLRYLGNCYEYNDERTANKNE